MNEKMNAVAAGKLDGFHRVIERCCLDNVRMYHHYIAIISVLQHQKSISKNLLITSFNANVFTKYVYDNQHFNTFEYLQVLMTF